MGNLRRQFTKEFKEEVLGKVKNEGKSVSEAASLYGITPKHIYNWLNLTVSPNEGILEINRLRREKDELLKIIGELTHDLKRGKKA